MEDAERTQIYKEAEREVALDWLYGHRKLYKNGSLHPDYYSEVEREVERLTRKRE